MATVQRYVDTASSGGDGTTQGHSGATAAYASLSSWEAAAGGSATDDYSVDCAGSAADTTAVVVDFATNITTGSVTINGDRAAPDGDGFYDGNVVISSSFYRLAPASTAVTLDCLEARTTIDGIQVESAHTSTNGVAIRNNMTGAFTVRKCRVRNGATCAFGIGNSAALSSSATRTFENNLSVGFTQAGIIQGSANFFGGTFNILQNTCYGDETSSFGVRAFTSGGSAAATINIKGNALANSGTDADISVTLTGTSTVTYADNATEDFDLGTTNEIDLGAPTDAWTSPGTTAASDFTVKNTSSALYNAVNPTLVTTDITDFTRDGTNHDVGAFEFQATSNDLSSAGSSTATANGAATAAVPISAAGSSVATAAGAGVSAADLSATGASTATLSGAATSTSDLSAVGAGLGTLESTSTASSVLSAAGTGVGTLEGAEVAPGVESTALSTAGTSTGELSGAAIGTSDLVGTGTSTGTLGSEIEVVEEPEEEPRLPLDGGAWGRPSNNRKQRREKEEAELMEIMLQVIPMAIAKRQGRNITLH